MDDLGSREFKSNGTPNWHSRMQKDKATNNSPSVQIIVDVSVFNRVCLHKSPIDQCCMNMTRN